MQWLTKVESEALVKVTKR